MAISRVTICGGGNAAHTLVGLIGNHEGVQVRLYVPLGDEAERLKAGIEKNGGITVHNGNRVYKRSPESVTRDPQEAVSGAHIVLLALPAFAHEIVLKDIAPFLEPGAWVGAIPARGGFDLCARSILSNINRKVTLFGFQTLPWACRIKVFGQEAVVLGSKEQVDIAVSPYTMSPQVAATLQSMVGVKLNFVSNFLSLTLSDTGQIIHPGIMYGLFHDWDGQPYAEPPLFYQSVDGEIAGILQAMSDEIQNLRREIEHRYPRTGLASVYPIEEWIQRSYSASIMDSGSLQSCFATNRSYTGLLAPVKQTADGYVPDFFARYLSEDVPYNLLVTRGIAELANVATPFLDQVIQWAQTQLGKEYLRNGRLEGKDIDATRTPQKYGFTDLAQLIEEIDHPSLSQPDSMKLNH